MTTEEIKTATAVVLKMYEEKIISGQIKNKLIDRLMNLLSRSTN